LNKQYGLSKGSNEAMFIIEAYRTLRDRGPYPADQVLKELDGSFGFVIYDNKDGTVFAASVSNIFQIASKIIILIYGTN
jgi:asparagine synthetase B (glutamine-hydrolysing)